MDKQTMKEEWNKAMDSLMTMDKGRRDHFATLIVYLSRCYIEDSGFKGVVLIDTGEALLTFSQGADEMEATEIISHANEIMLASATRDAPAKEMFN